MHWMGADSCSARDLSDGPATTPTPGAPPLPPPQPRQMVLLRNDGPQPLLFSVAHDLPAAGLGGELRRRSEDDASAAAAAQQLLEVRPVRGVVLPGQDVQLQVRGGGCAGGLAAGRLAAGGGQAGSAQRRQHAEPGLCTCARPLPSTHTPPPPRQVHISGDEWALRGALHNPRLRYRVRLGSVLSAGGESTDPCAAELAFSAECLAHL